MEIPVEEQFRLCDSINRKILEKYGEDAAATDLPELERVVVLVWTVTGIIENGGFEYLLSSAMPGDSNYKLSIQSFRTIGSNNALDAMNRAFAFFPDGIPPDDKIARLGMYKTHSETERRSINVAFYKALDEINYCLSKFVTETGLDVKWGETKVI